MAESSENKKHTIDKLSDELDSMLDDTESSMEKQNELIDDEDAIDRLLMDNAFDNEDEEENDEFAEIDELISESLEDSGNQASNEIEDIVDEFADDEDDFAAAEDESDAAAIVTDEPDTDEFGEADQEFSTSAPDPEDIDIEETVDELTEPENNDEFQEIGEMDGMNEMNESSDVEVEQSANKQSDDQDFLMADFDISADESTEEEELDEINEQTNPVVEQAPETEITEKAVQTEDKNIIAVEQNEKAFAEISAQLAALQNVQESLKQQITEISNKDHTTALTEELDSLQSEQKKIKRKLKTVDEKKPVLVYVALGVAILALLIGGGLGLVGFGADSKVSELSDLVVNIEDELEVLAEKDNPEKYNTVVNRLDRVDSEVANFSAQIAALNKTVEAFVSQPDGESFSKQISQLGDQSMQIGTAIESLQLQVDALENKRQSASVARKKLPVIQKKWVVNLVSFKQEWYAKRKAAEFEKKGVPVEVMKVVIKGNTWYRLRVKGFKSKYEAAAYAAKVKKSQNLTSVWVTKD